MTTEISEKLAPVHSGEILLEEYIKPLGISQYRLRKTSAYKSAASARSSTATG